MELGDSSQAKTLSTEFDADLTAWYQYCSGGHHSQKEQKKLFVSCVCSMVTKKLILIHFMIISYTYEEQKLKWISTYFFSWQNLQESDKSAPS